MDNYRGHFSDHSDTFDHSQAEDDVYDSIEDEVGRELPPWPVGQDERRMQVRAYNCWASLLEDRNFPAIDDFSLATMPELAPYSVILDFEDGVENPGISFLGDRLAEECGTAPPIRHLTDIPGRSLLSRITDHYMQILANEAPIGFEAEFVNQIGNTVVYRGILLPFSGDGEKIEHILGVINWKELADQATTDALLADVQAALNTSPAAVTMADPAPLPVLPAWADGPVDPDHDPDHVVTAMPEILDLAAFAEIPFPEPGFGAATAAADLAALPGDEPRDLADWLASARALADAARGSEDRSRAALYAAIGRAWDFALAAADAPAEFAALVEDAGFPIQERAPLTPVVKLVFGADYDKTRLTEYATALAHAQRLGLERGALADFIAQAPGGLKGVVQEERRLKRAPTGRPGPDTGSPRESLARKLRRITPRPLAAFAGDGGEFTVLLARRLENGEVVLLGEAGDDAVLLERIARRVLS